MSASSRMALEMEEAMSEASWTALAKKRRRDWWIIDLGGEVEELDREGEMYHQPDGEKAAVEEEESMGRLKMKWKLRKWMQACHKQRVRK